MDTSLLNNPMFQSLPKEKQQFLQAFAAQPHNGNANELAGQLSNAAMQAKAQGLSFTDAETTLLIGMLKQNMSLEEQKRRIVSYNWYIRSAHIRRRMHSLRPFLLFCYDIYDSAWYITFFYYVAAQLVAKCCLTGCNCILFYQYLFNRNNCFVLPFICTAISISSSSIAFSSNSGHFAVNTDSV